MKPAAIYARYSSDMQRDASIEDQIRLCRERAEREGWLIEEVYIDRRISGATLLRPGVQALLDGIARNKFRVVVAESLDRLSRDQEDIAHIFKRMQFADIDLVTLGEGEVSELHIGLKGTMSALYLKELAAKTRRGLRGRIEAGRSGGGNSFGYDVVPGHEGARGQRSINLSEAGVVRRIFNEYAEGRSPRAIARALNDEGATSPSGKPWGPSTIHGNRKRGTGILNNELYIGRLVWNRLSYVKDPETGKRVSRLNPEEQWIVKAVPQLRIIDQGLWDRVKARQQEMTMDSGQANRRQCGHDRRRPRYLFSGLMHCAVCGGTMAHFNKVRVGCANARNKGTCGNKATIKRDDLEQMVLDALRHHLMDPDLARVFSGHYARHANRLSAERNHERTMDQAELEKVEREQKRLLQAILDGVPGAMIKDKMQALEDRKALISDRLSKTPTAVPLLHPNMGTFYRQQIERLNEALTDPARQPRAAEVMRSLIECIVFEPITRDGKQTLGISLKGKIAGILALSSTSEAKLSGSDDAVLSENVTKLVAGVGFEPTTFRL